MQDLQLTLTATLSGATDSAITVALDTSGATEGTDYTDGSGILMILLLVLVAQQERLISHQQMIVFMMQRQMKQQPYQLMAFQEKQVLPKMDHTASSYDNNNG